MTLQLASALAIASCNLKVDAIDVGSAVAAGYFRIYSGVKPVDVAAALSGNTVLATIPCANPAFGAAADNPGTSEARATASAIAETPAAADGLATFYRQFNRDNVPIWQGVVGLPNTDTDMWVSNTTMVTGVGVVVLSYVIAEPY